MVLNPLFLLFTAVLGARASVFQRIPAILARVTESAAAAAPTIQTTVGTYQYRGCFQDHVQTIPPATSPVDVLISGVGVSGGVNAERCIAVCKSKGLPLAGLEQGSQCFCDSYMDIVNLVPDSQCNQVCTSDATELCGGSNRLAVYEDTSATPPSTQQCISGNIDTPRDFNLQAVPFPNGGAPIPLSAIVTDTNTQVLSLTEHIPGGFSLFFTQNSVNFNQSQRELWLDFTDIGGTFDDAVSLTPVVGQGLSFSFSIPSSLFLQFCAQPSPIPQFGPFIGPTVLSINGQSTQWALCPNTTASGRVDVVYSPVSNSPDYTLSQCQSVIIQIQYNNL